MTDKCLQRMADMHSFLSLTRPRPPELTHQDQEKPRKHNLFGTIVNMDDMKYLLRESRNGN